MITIWCLTGIWHNILYASYDDLEKGFVTNITQDPASPIISMKNTIPLELIKFMVICNIKHLWREAAVAILEVSIDGHSLSV
ncbi:hypothetical protein BC349_10595 [Flavihumibacter stibioxidans]|uniref:Uncharacterized protein n=1 Tax=Flavihumibacter stibioxidans TaxID=1834163 RepID=A0ABR7MAF2_9BACT|nr:hypothetical protein [Flavihumibacter stibioxidans]